MTNITSESKCPAKKLWSVNNATKFWKGIVDQLEIWSRIWNCIRYSWEKPVMVTRQNWNVRVRLRLHRLSLQKKRKIMDHVSDPNEPSMEAAVSRMIARDGLPICIIYSSWDVRLGLMARGFSVVLKSPNTVCKLQWVFIIHFEWIWSLKHITPSCSRIDITAIFIFISRPPSSVSLTIAEQYIGAYADLHKKKSG